MNYYKLLKVVPRRLPWDPWRCRSVLHIIRKFTFSILNTLYIVQGKIPKWSEQGISIIWWCMESLGGHFLAPAHNYHPSIGRNYQISPRDSRAWKRADYETPGTCCARAMYFARVGCRRLCGIVTRVRISPFHQPGQKLCKCISFSRPGAYSPMRPK